MSRAISVKSGSVQLRIEVDKMTFLVDVWSEGERWNWSAGREKGRAFAEGHRSRWSEARTSAFKACIRQVKVIREA